MDLYRAEPVNPGSCYPTRHDTSAHQALMLPFEREFAIELCQISADAFSAYTCEPLERPCPALWSRAKTAFGRLCAAFAATRGINQISFPAVRRATLAVLREKCASDPPTHAELSDRLVLMSYWCCLGHAGTRLYDQPPDKLCIRAFVYNRRGGICHRLFDAYLGCGVYPESGRDRNIKHDEWPRLEC
ncbi:unknown [Cercopithecine alphaherpesvirus 9]|uniref:Virion protein US10 homolog n=2 Tax=Cercopithecine alphaherpesvirus 9 TaxID=35246 RepID=Q77LR9_CHV9D|nr:virion protein US10 [Cercopithecine alphaherpesvirus 9]NP_077483.1 virion protein US10 [Cercopithecine alphaherpesvirus 9]AAB39967.1 unknown [Cercopithecine alphaherpesvirus 9]AAG27239.1 virion protein [Cercopithecine alphaherpesvirus 9]AAG27250.1 unknown [Cercopithecine alphaherpesvirus 9]